MDRFDFKAALREVAAPAVRTLNPDALWIYGWLRDAPEGDGLVQGRDLSVPMPETLRARFEAIPSDELAYAARVLHHFGHWGGTLDKRDTRGAYWKFSNLADQELRKRLELVDSGPGPIGYHFEIHEGALRLCASSPDFWTWMEIGPATESFYVAAREWRATLRGAPATRYSRSNSAWQAFEEAAHETMKGIPPELDVLLSNSWHRFLNVGKDYMRPEGKCSDDCPECGTSSIWKNPAMNHAPTCSHYPAVQELISKTRKTLADLSKECQRRGIFSDRISEAEEALKSLEAFVDKEA